MAAVFNVAVMVHPLVAPHRDDNTPPGYERNAALDQANYRKAVTLLQQRQRLEEARSTIEKKRLAEALKGERRMETERNTLRNKLRKSRKGKKGKRRKK